MGISQMSGYTKKQLLFFDLEGPLSPQDNAFEVMGLLPGGRQIFEVISRYDDLLALEGRVDYEPGDTLRLIVPFLVAGGIIEKQITEVSARAGLVSGAKELIGGLLSDAWTVYIVSTSYEQHAKNIARQIGLPSAQVLCTTFPLNSLKGQVSSHEVQLLNGVRDKVASELFDENLADGVKDSVLKPYLDEFYWQSLPNTQIGKLIGSVTVLGGRRKLWAMERVCVHESQFFEDVAFVGDSITDAQAARAIEAFGGLSLAFNANAFVLPYATVAVASASLYDIKPILNVWRRGGRWAVREHIEKQRGQAAAARSDWLPGLPETRMREVLSSHKEARARVRREAARLG